EEEPELAAGGGPRRRQAALALAAAYLPPPGVHLAVHRVVRPLELAPPLDGGQAPGVTPMDTGVVCSHGLVDGPLPLGDHLDHVAGVFDVVGLPLQLLPGPEESITLP